LVEMESIILGLAQLVADEPQTEQPSLPVQLTPPPAEDRPEEQQEPAALQQRHFDIRITPRSDSEGAGYSLDPLVEELELLGEVVVEDVPPEEGGGWTVALDTRHAEENVRDVFFFADIDLDVTIHSGEDGQPQVEEGTMAAQDDESAQLEKPATVAAPDVPVDESEPLANETPSEVESKVSEDGEDALESELSEGRCVGDEFPAVESSQEKITSPPSVQQPAPAPASPSSRPKPPPPSAAVPPAPASKTPREPEPQAVSSLRVDASKLDKLVDLVGELVIVQAQISEFAAKRIDPVLTVLSENLERLSDELRDTTLGVRMLPIGSTFSRFRRMVRDLSAELGKEIDLVTIGAETELDKTVIERLGDPLVHLLRNSIDHGIEGPEERLASGKPRQGTIRLSAGHSGGEVLISIEDDGRGMDFASICAHAKEGGLVPPDAELSEREVSRLIFEPGFSMAEEVTSVSGRGVGMDVVKRAIDSLRGTIDITSIPGQATTIVVRLPLTLAIIDGLQVRTGDEFYVIPLTLVEECVELVDGMRQEDGGRRILELRGEIVPYVNLREWFEVPGSRPEREQVVVTGVDGSRIGVVVDTVIGEHQTVIKTLGKVYRDVEGISGATIKGNGSIALILDVPGLVRRVMASTAAR
ncbi:MAG: chemotaxis protein CheA, partial [Proteobacteria bacterium]|nr:chemotaxis protein CheA [Pseudomonadota bacterium]